MSATRLAPGLVFGRYELLVPVGRGGMAEVWAARLRGSRGFQKIVALKVMLPYLAEDPNFERMFLDEASLASQVKHPNVIEILDLGEQEDVLYLVMEWVDGEPLNVILDTLAGAPLPLSVAAGIAVQTCAGLHAVHELRTEDGAPLGLVHRDVSPQNLLVGYDGTVKIVDFGVAKATLRLSDETKQGQLKGKFAYMAPEQLRGESVDRRADVFALGTVLYTMTTGRHPFKGDNEAVTITNVASDEPAAPPTRIVPGYPRAVESVVMAALAKDRNRRFESVERLRDAIVRALGGTVPASTAEVAGFLARAMPDRRAERRAAIKRALDDADLRGRVADAAHPDVSSDATLTRAASVDEVTRTAPRSSRTIYWFSAAALLGVAGVAFGVHSLGSRVPDATVARSAGLASASAEVAAPASASAAPADSVAEAPSAVRLEDLAPESAADAGTKAPSKKRVVRRPAVRPAVKKRTTTLTTKKGSAAQDPGF